MDAIRALPDCACRRDRLPNAGQCPLDHKCRAEQRETRGAEAARAWLGSQGSKAGFRLVGETAVDGYDTIRVPRTEGCRPVQYSVLDFNGVLEVTDPDCFLAALGHGLGRAKAFGCGLMLIRRAP